METKNIPTGSGGFTYMGMSFSDLAINDNSSSAFSDCNSDRSGEFSSASLESRRKLWLSCTGTGDDFSDDFIHQLVSGLESSSINDQKQAAMEIRLLAKNKQENRLKIAHAGTIKPLISLLALPDLQLQEYGVTTILDLFLWEENKDLFLCDATRSTAALVEKGGIPVLVEIVEVGSHRQKEIAAAILLQLCENSVVYRTMVARDEGAIPPLVALSQSGTTQAKKKVS